MENSLHNWTWIKNRWKHSFHLPFVAIHKHLEAHSIRILSKETVLWDTAESLWQNPHHHLLHKFQLWWGYLLSAPDAVQSRGALRKRSGTSALPTVYKRSAIVHITRIHSLMTLPVLFWRRTGKRTVLYCSQKKKVKPTFFSGKEPETQLFFSWPLHRFYFEISIGWFGIKFQINLLIIWNKTNVPEDFEWMRFHLSMLHSLYNTMFGVHRNRPCYKWILLLRDNLTKAL